MFSILRHQVSCEKPLVGRSGFSLNLPKFIWLVSHSIVINHYSFKFSIKQCSLVVYRRRAQESCDGGRKVDRKTGRAKVL